MLSWSIQVCVNTMNVTEEDISNDLRNTILWPINLDYETIPKVFEVHHSSVRKIILKFKISIFLLCCSSFSNVNVEVHYMTIRKVLNTAFWNYKGRTILTSIISPYFFLFALCGGGHSSICGPRITNTISNPLYCWFWVGYTSKCCLSPLKSLNSSSYSDLFSETNFLKETRTPIMVLLVLWWGESQTPPSC